MSPTASPCEGYHAALCRRSDREGLNRLVGVIEADGGTASGYLLNAVEEGTIEDSVQAIERDVGPVEVAVYNLGAQIGNRALADTSHKAFEMGWRLATFGLFRLAQTVCPRMAERGTGTLLVTSATAAMRGNAGQHAHAAAMGGRRLLCQTLNAEYGPQGIHVAHIVVDGAVDAPDTLGKMLGPERYQQLRETRGMSHDGLMLPERIADTYWHHRAAAPLDLDPRTGSAVVLRQSLVERLTHSTMNTAPEFGLNRFDSTSTEAFAADVARAEELGFGYALIPWNPLARPDPYMQLAVAAGRTSRIKLGLLLDNPVLHHPATSASSIATLDEISGSRAILTYGIGDTAVRWLGLRPARLAQLEQATVLAKRLLHGEAVELGAVRPAKLQHARPVPVWDRRRRPQDHRNGRTCRRRRFPSRRPTSGEPCAPPSSGCAPAPARQDAIPTPSASA